MKNDPKAISPAEMVMFGAFAVGTILCFIGRIGLGLAFFVIGAIVRFAFNVPDPPDRASAADRLRSALDESGSSSSDPNRSL